MVRRQGISDDDKSGNSENDPGAFRGTVGGSRSTPSLPQVTFAGLLVKQGGGGSWSEALRSTQAAHVCSALLLVLLRCRLRNTYGNPFIFISHEDNDNQGCYKKKQ